MNKDEKIDIADYYRMTLPLIQQLNIRDAFLLEFKSELNLIIETNNFNYVLLIIFYHIFY